MLNKIIDMFIDYNKYRMRSVHDDMFFEYVESVEKDSEDDYKKFKKEYYSNLIKQQRFY